MNPEDILEDLKKWVKGENMEYNLVFLGERNKKKILEDISSNLSLPRSTYQVTFLTNNEMKKNKFSKINKNLNFNTITYEKHSTNESMFESFIQKEGLKNVILFKDSAIDLNFKDINKMIEQQKNGSLLIVSKQDKKENFFRKTFKVVRDFLTKLFLGIRLFDDNADVILFDRLLVAIMQEMPGKSSILTKINAWAGVTPTYVKINSQPPQVKKYKLKEFTSVLTISGILLLLIVADIILLALSVKMHFIWLLLIVAMHFVLLILLLYSVTKKVFKVKFGDVGPVPEARILHEFDNFDE